jgi:hypothetical protein
MTAEQTAGQTAQPPAQPTASGGELFGEKQPLHQNMIVRVLVPLETVIAVAVVVPLLMVSPTRPDWPVLVLIGLVMIGVPAGLLLIRMTTIVTTDELIVRYRPFPGRRVPIGAIRSAEAIRYNPLASGGWGWRISGRYHRVMNVSGDRGVHVIWGDARADQALLGSRDAEGLAEAIELARFSASERAGGTAA